MAPPMSKIPTLLQRVPKRPQALLPHGRVAPPHLLKSVRFVIVPTINVPSSFVSHAVVLGLKWHRTLKDRYYRHLRDFSRKPQYFFMFWVFKG